ncbi:MAG: hypothetical protein NXY57DRAFT_1037618 [Lentinula lateritia]|nr:MAG: hypothetical protein NXY57DRAFT_1037618 [Lentinula lateritia]
MLGSTKTVDQLLNDVSSADVMVLSWRYCEDDDRVNTRSFFADLILPLSYIPVQRQQIERDDAWSILQSSFSQANYVTNKVLGQLVDETGLSPSRIKAWYEYRRRLQKRRKLEVQSTLGTADPDPPDRNEAESTTTPSANVDKSSDVVFGFVPNKEQIQIAPSVDALESSDVNIECTLCAVVSHEDPSLNRPTLPSISSMFPEIFNDQYDYTLPPNVHPIVLPTYR